MLKTICIAGKNDIAVDVMLYLKKNYSDYRLVCIYNRNETGVNSWQKSLKWFAEKNGVEEVTLDQAYQIPNLLFLSLEFDRIIKPSKFISDDLYNIHFSLLPQYKGMYTSVLPILNDESYTGVTLHKIRDGIDTGEIVDAVRIPIKPDDSSLDLYISLINSGVELVKKNLPKLLSGDVICFPQSAEKSTYYPKSEIDYTTLSLNVNCTAYQIKNQIRAFNFRPYQLLTWNGIRYLDSVILPNISYEKPGTIIKDDNTSTIISTIDYDIRLFKDTFDQMIKYIIDKNNDAVIELLVTNKLLVSKESHGWTLLTVAVYNDNYEMVVYLVNHGADYHVINNNGTNLLMYAKDCYVIHHNTQIFEYLLNLGLSPLDKDYNGLSLIDYCRLEGISEIGSWKIDD